MFRTFANCSHMQLHSPCVWFNFKFFIYCWSYRISADLWVCRMRKRHFCESLPCLCWGSALGVPGEHHRCALQSNPGPAVMLPTAGMDTEGLVVVTENTAWDGKNSRCQIGHESLTFTAAVVISLRQHGGIDGSRTEGRIWAYTLDY